jgi:hypothetical protein
MDIIRQMPDKEKFQHAFGMVRLYQKHVLPFVEERLGFAAMHELNAVWQAAIIPIRDEVPDQENYEAAYSNWLWMARCSHDYLADLLDHQAVIDYKRLLLQLYKHQQDNPDLAIYRMFGNFTALAKSWAYEMQWITPIESISRGKEQYTCVVNNCKVLQTPATERVCRVDCRNVGTNLARKVYHLQRQTIAVDHGCTIILTPLRAEEEE